MFLITFLAPLSLSRPGNSNTEKKVVVKLHTFAVSNPSLFVTTAEKKNSHGLGHRL